MIMFFRGLLNCGVVAVELMLDGKLIKVRPNHFILFRDSTLLKSTNKVYNSKRASMVIQEYYWEINLDVNVNYGILEDSLDGFQTPPPKARIQTKSKRLKKERFPEYSKCEKHIYSDVLQIRDRCSYESVMEHSKDYLEAHGLLHWEQKAYDQTKYADSNSKCPQCQMGSK